MAGNGNEPDVAPERAAKLTRTQLRSLLKAVGRSSTGHLSLRRSVAIMAGRVKNQRLASVRHVWAFRTGGVLVGPAVLGVGVHVPVIRPFASASAWRRGTILVQVPSRCQRRNRWQTRPQGP